MPYYFGKDKGFFAAEQIEPQLVMMAPPTAIAALVGGRIGLFLDHRRGDLGDHARPAASPSVLRPAGPGPCACWRSRRSNQFKI